MMRLLFLCLLLLPAATAFSEETEGSANEEVDDEDGIEDPVIPEDSGRDLLTDKTKGTEEPSDQTTMIVIIVAVAALALSVSAIVTIMLVRRHMQKREQGIYSVPAEQDQKGV